MSGSRLAALVLSTMRLAQARITDQVADVLRHTVGDDPATVASMVASYRQRFPEPEPEIGRTHRTTNCGWANRWSTTQHAAHRAPTREPRRPRGATTTATTMIDDRLQLTAPATRGR
jgi:hypothetical protein